MQQEVNEPAVSSISNRVLLIRAGCSVQEVNEQIRASSHSSFAIIPDTVEEAFLHKSVELLAKKEKMGAVVQHHKGIALCGTKILWKYLHGFNETLPNEGAIRDFFERAVVQREFTVAEFFK
jgi:hypothetical protein